MIFTELLKKTKKNYVKYAIFARFYAALNFRTHAGGQPGQCIEKFFFAYYAQENFNNWVHIF